MIREIVCGLWTQYGVREIFGIDVSNKPSIKNVILLLISNVASLPFQGYEYI